MYKIFSSWLFYFMLAHLGLLVLLFIYNFKYLYNEIKKINKKYLIILFFIFLFGFYLRNSEYWMGPFSDGYVAGESAHMWVLNGEFVKSCALGNYLDCKLFEQVLAPPGLPFIIASADLIFGIHSLNASVVSAILSSFVVLIIFLIAYLLFKKEEIGLYSSLVYSLIPLNIIYSQTGEARPAGLFFFALTVLFFLLAIKNNKIVTWALAITSLSYAIYVRQESYILVPFFAIFFLIFKWVEIKEYFSKLIKKKKDLKIIFYIFLFGFLFLIIQLPVLNWLLFNNPYNSYQGGGFFALHYKGILVLAPALLGQFVNYTLAGSQIFHYNLISSIVFFASFIFILIFPDKKKLFLASLFIAYFCIYSTMFDGNIYGTGELTGDYFRRSTMFHLPYSIIAGFGFYVLFYYLKNKKWLLVPIFLILVSFNFTFLDNKIELRSWKENLNFYFPKSIFKDSRATKTGDRSIIYPSVYYWPAIEKIPNGCHVISSQHMLVNNDYFKNNTRKTVAIDLIFDSTEKLFFDELSKSNCIFYLQDYRCSLFYRNSDDYGCNFINKYFDKELVFSFPEISGYRMKLKK